MNIVIEAHKFALSEIEKNGSPSRILFEISENKAIELAKRLNADETLVRVGVALMDIKIGQALKENRVQEHITMGVEESRRFLKRFNLDKKFEEKIINCIEAHHGTAQFSCIEAEICANADCYRFIHPRGFFAFIHSLASEGMGFDECLSFAEAKLDEKNKILSLGICKEELEPHYAALKQYILILKKQ
jgi:hypothetical protein